MSRLDRLYSPPEIGAPGKRRNRRLHRDLLLSGLFVTAMALVLIGALAWLRPSLLGQSTELVAYFSNAKGLTPGIPVVLEDYEIGVLRRVAPTFPTAERSTPCNDAADAERSPILPCFEVTLRIGSQWKIPADSQIEIGSAGPLQGDTINIIAGKETEFLAEQASFRQLGHRNDLLSQAGVLVDSVRRLLEDKVDPTVAKIQQKIVMLEEMLETAQAEPGEQIDYRARLLGIFNNLEALIERLKDSVDPDNISQVMAKVEAVAIELRKTTGEIRGLVEDTRPPLRRSLDDAQFLTQELAAALTPILTNIDDTTRNLSAITRDLRNNPAILLKGRRTEKEAPWFSDDPREDQGTPWFSE